jgi:hypothetical protein
MSKVGFARPNGNQAGRVLRWRLLRTRTPGVDIISGASLDQKNKCIPGRSSILMPQEDTGLRRACTSHDLLSRRLSLLKPGYPIGESDRSRPCCPRAGAGDILVAFGNSPLLGHTRCRCCPRPQCAVLEAVPSRADQRSCAEAPTGMLEPTATRFVAAANHAARPVRSATASRTVARPVPT